MTKPMFDTIALIGIGLIGSSLARVIAAKGLARHVAIATRSAATLDTARALDLGDSYHTSNAEVVRDADLVIVSVPVGASGAVAREIGSSHLKPGAIVTDVGSTKAFCGQPDGAAYPGACAFHCRPPDCRH
jgi:cyclohexadieny/prephenate dehydrogenase